MGHRIAGGRLRSALRVGVAAGMAVAVVLAVPVAAGASRHLPADRLPEGFPLPSLIPPFPVTASTAVEPPPDDDAAGIESATFLDWATRDGGPDWREGTVLAVMGLGGALVALYFFLGERLPGMGGAAREKRLTAEIETLRDLKHASLERRLALAAADSVDEPRLAAEQALTLDLEAELSRREIDLSRDRRDSLRRGSLLYLVIGAFFATAVATNLLQAVLVGFGWTAVANGIGLKRDEPELKALQAETVATITERLEEENRELRALVLGLGAEISRDQPDSPQG